MHEVENHYGLHSVNFLIYHIGMEVGIEGPLVICCAIALALIYDTTMVVPRNKKKQFEIVRSLRTICL